MPSGLPAPAAGEGLGGPAATWGRRGRGEGYAAGFFQHPIDARPADAERHGDLGSRSYSAVRAGLDPKEKAIQDCWRTV